MLELGDVRALFQMAAAQLRGGGLEAFQVAPMRAQPYQQPAQQRRADQHVHAPVQQVHVQRVGRDGQFDRQLLIERRADFFHPAPLPQADHRFALLQQPLLIWCIAGVLAMHQLHLQWREVPRQLLGDLGPALHRPAVVLAHDQALQAPGLLDVVVHVAVVEDLDDAHGDQVDRRAVGHDGQQVETDQDAEHGVSIPTRNG